MKSISVIQLSLLALLSYMGNTVSLKFHVLDCPYARIMGLSKREYFEDMEVCKSRGFRPCRFCLPPFNLSVSARLATDKLTEE